MLFAGDRARTLREQAGMSREYVAYRLNRSAAAIAHWEVGRREPERRADVVALAELLGVEVGDLYDDEPEAVAQ